MSTANNKAAHQKAFNDACMDISLKVSEFFVHTEQYFSAHNIKPKVLNNETYDIKHLQKQFNIAFEKHVLLVAQNKQNINSVDIAKIKYFQTGFENFKKEVATSTVEYFKKRKTPNPYYGYMDVLRDIRKFSEQIGAVIDNWTENYTVIIEKNMLEGEIAAPSSKSQKSQPNKI